MSIFSKIKDAIFGHKSAPAPTPAAPAPRPTATTTAQTGAPAAPPPAQAQALQPVDVAAMLPVPGPFGHKYTRGVVGVRAGSPTYPGAAVLCTSGAVSGLAIMLTYFVQTDVSTLYLVAIMFSAWRGSLGAGLLATLMSVVIATYFFLPPIYSLTLKAEGIVEMVVFALAAVLVSSLSASRMSRSGSRWMRPAMRNGGIETIARSGTFGVRSSGTASTLESPTAKSTAERLTCAYSARTAISRLPYSSITTSVRTMKSCSVSLRMSVMRRWRVRIVPRIT